MAGVGLLPGLPAVVPGRQRRRGGRPGGDPGAPRLPAETLGVDAIWLSPFYPSPMADFGYDVADYCDVDPLFGDLATFDRLLAGAHERGLRLIVDLVPNHTSDQHPWFMESRSSRRQPQARLVHLARPGAGRGARPTTGRAVFGGPAWTVGREPPASTTCTPSCPSSPTSTGATRRCGEAMRGVMRFWLDRGVDGFRIDVADFLMKDPESRRRPPAWRGGPIPLARSPRRPWGLPRHAIPARRLHPQRVAVGEIHEDDLAVWASYYGDGGELHLPFNFSLLRRPVGRRRGAPPGGGARSGPGPRSLAQLRPGEPRRAAPGDSPRGGRGADGGDAAAHPARDPHPLQR